MKGRREERRREGFNRVRKVAGRRREEERKEEENEGKKG